MISPLLLIAEREFRTYVATLSFWLSLAIAPLGAVGVLIFSGHQQPLALVTIQAGDPAIGKSAKRALEEAGRLEGRPVVFGQGGASIVLSPVGPRVLEVAFGADFPLSPVGRAMVRHLVERDAARDGLANAPLMVREKSHPVVAADTGALSRLVAMTMLWLMLTGSLGMLLQAVVRERANRALESLLACARPWQIVAGKMLGVGAVSLLVLAVWGGTALVLSLFAGRGGLIGGVLTGFSDPVMLARDGLIYLCAFVFYGSATVMLGALARDNASAQNAVRPMFVLLLAGFFVALMSAGQSHVSPWLICFPPFTPFLLLVSSPGAVAEMTQIIPQGVLFVSSMAMLFVAARSLNIAPRNNRIFSGNFSRPLPLV
jgi:ABC-type Na+ efflux pump permease subunit